MLRRPFILCKHLKPASVHVKLSPSLKFFSSNINNQALVFSLLNRSHMHPYCLPVQVLCVVGLSGTVEGGRKNLQYLKGNTGMSCSSLKAPVASSRDEAWKVQLLCMWYVYYEIL